jgi:hypothetical protein
MVQARCLHGDHGVASPMTPIAPLRSVHEPVHEHRSERLTPTTER